MRNCSNEEKNAQYFIRDSTIAHQFSNYLVEMIVHDSFASVKMLVNFWIKSLLRKEQKFRRRANIDRESIYVVFSDF